MAVKIKVKSGDPKKGVAPEEVLYSKGRTPLDTTADVRDILTGLVGKGVTNLNDENSRADYARLRALVGDSQAQKLATHVFIQNQRPGAATLPVEARIKSFYDIPSSDPEVAGVLGKVKSIGYGVLPGFRSSSSQVNQTLAGRVPNSVAVVDPAIEKVKVRIANKL